MKKWALAQLFVLYAVGFCWADVTIHEHDGCMTIDSIYGRDEIDEPVLIALIKSPMMQRLKKIRQYGIAYYIDTIPEYTRFEHSVMVMAMSRRFGASLQEQVAALLHDVSHTAFSHVADYLFRNGDGKTSYQDDMHEWFIEVTGINALLAEYGMKGICSDYHKHTYRILEQDLPDLCTDRIEYNLKGGHIENLLTTEQVKAILNDLRYKDGQWFFVREEAALLISQVSLQLTEHTFCTCHNFFTYRSMATALKRAMAIGLCSMDELCFSYDDMIWNRLNKSEDVEIRQAMDCVLHWKDHCIQGTPESYDLHIKGKFRGINPWVKTDAGFERLTDINPAYKQEYERVRQYVSVGCYLKYIE